MNCHRGKTGNWFPTGANPRYFHRGLTDGARAPHALPSRMLGYIVAAIIGIIVIGFAFSSLGGGSPPARKKDSAAPGKVKPVQADEPYADEPTPDRSTLASNHEIESAKRHTPPA